MKIYIASSLENKEKAAQLIHRIRLSGHTITYDWTQRGDVRNDGELAMMETAQSEVNAVTAADMVIIMLPGGRGTHTELGVALATRERKKIWVWADNDAPFGPGTDTCVFYHHPDVTCLSCSLDELCKRVNEAMLY